MPPFRSGQDAWTASFPKTGRVSYDDPMRKSRLTGATPGREEAIGASPLMPRRSPAPWVVMLASAFLAVMHPGSAPAQHLGETICSVDSAFVGAILAMKDRSVDATASGSQRRYELTARVDQAIKAATAGRTLTLELSTREPVRHIAEGSTYVFLLSRGKLVSIQPGEHATMVKKLLGDPSHCKRS